jgi:hypothetical protein
MAPAEANTPPAHVADEEEVKQSFKHHLVNTYF